MNFTQVVIAGRLVREPEIRYIPSGTAVCNITLAVSAKVGQGEEEKGFFDVTLWGKTAEAMAEYAVKGQVILATGRLRHERWQDQDGSNRQKVSITAQSFQFGQKPAGNQDDRQNHQRTGHYESQYGMPSEESNYINDDDIPF